MCARLKTHSEQIDDRLRGADERVGREGVLECDEAGACGAGLGRRRTADAPHQGTVRDAGYNGAVSSSFVCVCVFFSGSLEFYGDETKEQT